MLDPYPAQISLNFLAGHLAPEAIRLVGLISNHHVVLLVNRGNTHNFVQHRLITQLGLSCWATSSLRMMVGNDQNLECTSICERVSIIIQDIIFTMDLYVLPISGANVVLGVQWLKILGPVLTNYSTLCIQFFYQGRLVELKGENEAKLGLLT